MLAGRFLGSSITSATPRFYRVEWLYTMNYQPQYLLSRLKSYIQPCRGWCRSFHAITPRRSVLPKQAKISSVSRQRAPHFTSNHKLVRIHGLVFEARLILGQRKSHVFSQPPVGYSRMSTAPPAPSCGNTRIKGRPLIEPLIDADYGVIRVIRGPSIYKKVLPTWSLIAAVRLLLYLLYKMALTSYIEINIANNTKLRANA